MGQSIEKAIAAAMAARCCGNCEHWRRTRPLSDRLGRCVFPMPSAVESSELTGLGEGEDCPQFKRKGDPS